MWQPEFLWFFTLFYQQFPLFSLLPLSPSQQNSLTVVDGFIKVKSG